MGASGIKNLIEHIENPNLKRALERRFNGFLFTYGEGGPSKHSDSLGYDEYYRNKDYEDYIDYSDGSRPYDDNGWWDVYSDFNSPPHSH